MRLAVFDFDSTLMDGETIDLLAKAYGKEEEVSKITKEAMNGELDFYQSLKKEGGDLSRNAFTSCRGDLQQSSLFSWC